MTEELDKKATLKEKEVQSEELEPPLTDPIASAQVRTILAMVHVIEEPTKDMDAGTQEEEHLEDGQDLELHMMIQSQIKWTYEYTTRSDR